MKIVEAFYFKIYTFLVDITEFIDDEPVGKWYSNRIAINSAFLLSMLLSINLGVITSLFSKAKWFNFSFVYFFPLLLFMFFYFVIDNRYLEKLKSYRKNRASRWFLIYFLLTIGSIFVREIFSKPIGHWLD